jgi:hypothetical protein
MVLSIDGASQAVYERFRKKGSLELVCDNIRKLVAARQRLGKRTPVISWQFLAFRHNWQEIPLALDLARELGVDEFRLAAPFDVSCDDPQIHVATAEMISRSLNLISESKVIKIPQWRWPETVIFTLNADCAAAMSGNWNPFPALVMVRPPSDNVIPLAKLLRGLSREFVFEVGRLVVIRSQRR